MTYERLPLKPWHYGEPMDCWLYPHVASRLDALIAKHDVRSVLEIGTAYGCSAIWFAQHRQIDTVDCIDMWPDIPEHGLFDVAQTFMRNVRASLAKIVIINGNSHDEEVLAQLVESYDLVYLDGDHTYEGVKQDIEMYGPLARKVLCGDDYDAEVPGLAGVIRAVDELLPNRQTHGRLWYVEK